MNERSYLNLFLENNQKFFVRTDLLINLSNELEDFIVNNPNMQTMEFTKKVLFSHELQANNQVEGYGDDILIINDIIQRRLKNIKDIDKKKRIINLYKGYQFILKHKKVNEQSLKKLYDILSNGLLTQEEVSSMGKFYREAPVYILENELDLENCEKGIDFENIDKLMKYYFDFFNLDKKRQNSMIDSFIVSQILHLYFVYIHPYFDVNGRTSRTLAMWYLLKHEAYPFIIFNRGITFHKTEYYNAIKRAKKTHDLTPFITYMMNKVKLELEKELIVENIAQNVNVHLTSEDFQTLLYFLSINGLKTVLDFSTLYNCLNDKQKIRFIYANMIKPLIDKNILTVIRSTNKNMYGNTLNIVLEINRQNIDCDLSKIKKLVL